MPIDPSPIRQRWQAAIDQVSILARSRERLQIKNSARYETQDETAKELANICIKCKFTFEVPISAPPRCDSAGGVAPMLTRSLRVVRRHLLSRAL